MRMGELVNRTGIHRQTIHFYLRKGYLHQPIFKEGKHAYYDESHVEKLLFIKKCREEGIPLPSIQELWNVEVCKAKTSRPRGAKGSATREQIVQAATRAFLRKGYHQTNISEIMERVGLSKTAFYYYYENKKDLYFSCLDNIVQFIFQHTWDDLREEKDPMKRWEMRWQFARDFFPELMTILQLAKETMRDEDEEIRHKTEEALRKSFIEPLAKDIDMGIEAGLYHVEESEIAAFACIALLEAVAYRPMFKRDYTDEKIKRAFLDLFYYGLMGKPRRIPASTDATKRAAGES